MSRNVSMAFGVIYEQAFGDIMRARGYVTKVIGGASDDVDVLLENPGAGRAVAVEVKASSLRWVNQKRRGYQFLLFKAERSKTIAEDFIALACARRGQPCEWFIVPRARAAGVHCIGIPNRCPGAYRGRWAEFLGRFDLIDRALK